MDSAQRFHGALNRETHTPPPVFFTGGGWVGRLSGLPRDALLNDPAALAAAQIRAHEVTGQDALLAYFDALFIPEAYGGEIRFLETGPVVEPLPRADAGFDNPTLSDGRLPVVAEAVTRLAQYGAGRVPVGTLFEGPLTTLARLLDTEQLLRLALRNPERVTTALEQITEFLIRFGCAMARAGADFLYIPDPVASSTMISPAMYRKFALPAQQRLFAALSVPAVLHICGNTEPILALMAESGAAALSLDQCMDMGAAREAAGTSVALAGNVDPMTLFMGSEADVERETRAILARGGREGFLLMPGCAVPPLTPVENLLAMFRAARGA